MQRARGALLGLIAMTLAAAAHPAERPAQWLELQTTRFTAVSEMGEKQSRTLLERLQMFEAALPSITNVNVRAEPRVPTRVFLLGEDRFRRVTARLGDVAGVFSSRPFGNDLVVNASGPSEYALYSIYHEYVHYALRTEGHLTLPAFYEEGLAQFAQSFKILNRRFHYAYYYPGYQARSQAMPLKTVIGTRVGDETYRSHRMQPAFYSRSLLLMHYFSLGNRAQNPQFLRFVVRVANGEEPEEAFTAEFGMTPDAFDAQLDAYVPKASLNHMMMPVDSLPKRQPASVRPKPVLQGDMAYADLLLRFRVDTSGVERTFEAALAQKPDDAAAMVSMAHWHQQNERFNEADVWIEKAVALEGADAETLVRAADLYNSRGTPGSFGSAESLRIARRAHSIYKRALQKEPQHLAAAYGYGLTQPQAAPDEAAEAQRLVAEALQRYPESAELRFAMAQQLVQAGQEDQARSLYRLIACRSVDAELRAIAREQNGGPVRCQRVQGEE